MHSAHAWIGHVVGSQQRALQEERMDDDDGLFTEVLGTGREGGGIMG